MYTGSNGLVGWVAQGILIPRTEQTDDGTSGKHAEAQTLGRLDKELAGYGHLCESGSGAGGPVFALVTEGCRIGQGKLQSLKYSDAEETLRAGDNVVNLEHAVLNACTGDQPSLESEMAPV